jgi:site-specific DNA-cytosine methylase
MPDKPLCIDLFCGEFLGWTLGFLAEGYRVIGYDIIQSPRYIPDGFTYIRQDVRTVRGAEIIARFGRPRVVVGSPPCERYSIWSLPPTWRHSQPRWPQEDLWDAAERIGQETGAPLIIENVRGVARGFL